MPGSMSLADLLVTHKAALMDAADVFASGGSEDLELHLKTAADDFRRVKPNMQYGEITLVAEQRAYALPAGIGDYRYDTWGQRRKLTWERGYSGRLPRTQLAVVAGVQKLVLDPAPTQANIDDAGSILPYYHAVPHVIHATDGAQTTIPLALRGLLILRAQVEAMRQLAMRNSQKQVSMMEGYGNVSRNGTASYLFEALSQEFELKAAA